MYLRVYILYNVHVYTQSPSCTNNSLPITLLPPQPHPGPPDSQSLSLTMSGAKETGKDVFMVTVVTVGFRIGSVGGRSRTSAPYPHSFARCLFTLVHFYVAW